MHAIMFFNALQPTPDSSKEGIQIKIPTLEGAGVGCRLERVSVIDEHRLIGPGVFREMLW